MKTTRKLLAPVAFGLVLGSTAAGCVGSDVANGEGLTRASAPAEGQTSQALTLIPLPTCANADPDVTLTTPPAGCGGPVVYQQSVNDQYGQLFCDDYVVDFTYRPVGVRAGWAHNVHSQAECEALHASYTLYTQSGGAWTVNGTARYHGEWFDSGVFVASCSQVLDAGSTEPVPGVSGTAWRVAVRAYEQNCGTSCYSDKKRVFVSLPANPC